MPRYIDHDQRRREIIEVATDLVVSRGRAALTIRNVAEAAGWSTKAVSHYFADMAALLHATYTAAADRAKVRVDAVIAADALDVQGFVEALLPMDTERRRDWAIWFAFWSEALTSDAFGAHQRERTRSNTARLSRMLRQRRDAGCIDEASDIDAASRRLSALIPGIAGLAMFDSRGWPPARQRSVVASELRLMGVH